MTRVEFEAWLDSHPEIAEYVTSDLFIQRAKELCLRLETSQLTVEQGAKIVGFPVDVFRHLYGGYLAWQAIKRDLGTEH